jgi:hypothetical protein
LIGRKTLGVLTLDEYAMPLPAMQRARRCCSMIFLHGAMTFLTGQKSERAAIFNV